MSEKTKTSHDDEFLAHPVTSFFKNLKGCLEQHANNWELSTCHCKDELHSIRNSISTLEHCHLQDNVWRSEENVSTLRNCVDLIFPHANGLLMPDKLPEDKQDIANEFVMCIANLTTGNDEAVVKFCDAFDYPCIFGILKSCPVMVAEKWCAVILSVLLQESIARPFLDAVPTTELVSQLCLLYSEGSQHACFALFCLEHILCRYSNYQRLNDVWSYLGDVYQLLVLSVCQAIIAAGPSHKRNILASEDCIKFFCTLFCCESNAVLDSNQELLDKCNPHVLREVCATILCAASTLPHSDYLQAHALETLLPTTVHLLKTLNLATFKPDDKACHDTAAGQWVGKKFISGAAGIGLRCDLVQIIGNLVSNHEQNQNLLCSIGGLEEIFCSCRRDERNPLIQEAVIFGLSCGLKGNPENAQHLKNKLANRKDGQSSALMERLGLKPDEFVQVPSQK